MSEGTWKSSNMLLFAILHQELCYVCCCFVVRSFCLEFLLNVCIHVQYTRTESDRLGYATVRLTGSPIARDLEKYTEVFTEGVKCWRIDSIGHGRTRPVSLCVGVTERKSDRERLRKIH